MMQSGADRRPLLHARKTPGRPPAPWQKRPTATAAGTPPRTSRSVAKGGLSQKATWWSSLVALVGRCPYQWTAFPNLRQDAGVSDQGSKQVRGRLWRAIASIG